MYTIHQTEGIILETIHTGEVDCFYYIYTKDFGLLGMLATGVRLEKSKLRYSLQTFSKVSVGFVKGKNVLRITHAERVGGELSIPKERFLARLFERLRRLVRGEDKNTELYDLLENTYEYVLQKYSLTQEEEYSVELLYTIRLLAILGYWAPDILDIPYLQSPISSDLCSEILKKRTIFLPRIRVALEATQL